MTEFSQIDKDLSIYRDCKVLLWGAGVQGYRVKQILDNHGIETECFVDRNPDRHKETYCGIPVISVDAFAEKVKGNTAYLVQISCEDEYEIVKYLDNLKVRYISFAEFNCRAEQLGKYLLLKDDKQLKSVLYENTLASFRVAFKTCVVQYLFNGIMSDSPECNMVVSMPKTGNTSLLHSYHGSAMFTAHTFGFIEKDVMDYIKQKEVNILCGVRDMISQNFSLCYEMMHIGLCWDMDEFWEGGGDVETIFNKYFISDPADHPCVYSQFLNEVGYDYRGPEFFDKQLKRYFDIDVYEYPFDKEAGYIIIHKGNVNVMIYQMERMNDLEKQFAEFHPYDAEFTLLKHNDADRKWYHSSYKKAQKEIRFDRKYFLECYEGKYMKHFYSDEDIERFKQKWIGNVRN